MVKLRSRKEVIAYGAGPDVITAIDRITPYEGSTTALWDPL